MRESGEPLLVTDRGEVIAELRPVAKVGKEPEQAALLRLAKSGDLQMGRASFRDFKPMSPRRTASISAVVLEDR